MAWSLQGSYGRAAASLIEQGYIEATGVITQKARDWLDEHTDCDDEGV